MAGDAKIAWKQVNLLVLLYKGIIGYQNIEIAEKH